MHIILREPAAPTLGVELNQDLILPLACPLLSNGTEQTSLLCISSLCWLQDAAGAQEESVRETLFQ